VRVDDELVASAKQGSQDAWARLYTLHAGRLLVWVGTLATGDTAAAAEDVAAESWLVASQKISGFTGTTAEFAGWLFGIARKVNANGRRKTGRRLTSPHPVGPDDEALWGCTDGGLPRVEAMDFVRRTLATLSPREAQVVACRTVVGLDVAGTAEALGIRPTAVRVAHHRALKRVRESFGAAGAAALSARTPLRGVTILLAGDR
jgi:RNA polymerase sigma-70 factor (ECF subfamily)